MSTEINCKNCDHSLNNQSYNSSNVSNTHITPLARPEKKLGKKLYLIFSLIVLSAISIGAAPQISGIVIVFSAIFIIMAIVKHNQDNKRRRLLAAFQFFNASDVDNMDGVEFEDMVKLVFENLDFKVSTTAITGDYGVDLIMEQGGKKIGVQTKRYSSKVSLDAVQEIVAGIPYYKLSEGWVVTNNYFTEPAKKLAASNNVILIDRDGLEKCVNDAYQNMLNKNF